MDFRGLEKSFTLENHEYHMSFEDDMKIDPMDLTNEFVCQPLKFIWWAQLTEIARDTVNRKKYEMEKFYALADHEARSRAEEMKIRITEKVVENQVITNPIYSQMMDEYLGLKKTLGMLLAGKEAMLQRKDMLISLGANYRAEGNAEPYLLKESVRERQSKEILKQTKEKKVKSQPEVGEEKTQKKYKINREAIIKEFAEEKLEYEKLNKIEKN